MSRRPLVIYDPEDAADEKGKKPKKPKKLTWDDVFKDFKKRHPSKWFAVMKWEAANYATIRIFLHDGRVLLYDYDTKEAVLDPEYM